MPSDVSQQLSGVTWSDTYWHDAAKKENRFKMVLESLPRLNKVKDTNVKRIGKTYLKLRGYLNTEIYGICKNKTIIYITNSK
jgi:hypothetical protein